MLSIRVAELLVILVGLITVGITLAFSVFYRNVWVCECIWLFNKSRF